MGFFKKKQPAAASIPVHGPVEFIICGLGNPGSKYGNTRHNIGFCALDVLATDCGAAVERSRFHAMTGEAMRFYKLPPERLIVLSDDISLPVGKMRIRTKGSAGGHNGLKDIILKLGSDNFPRIKFGVGAKPNPEYDLADWVLGQCTEAEGKALYPLLQNTAEACTLIMQGKPEEAMSRFN